MLAELLRFTGDHQAFALELQIDGTNATVVPGSTITIIGQWRYR
jgi:hypothetical protein